MADDEEDDYLSMSFAEPATKAKETSLQRTARLKREAAERARPLSKKELAAKAEAARDLALATKLDATTNKGAKLMAKMGFKGGALGAVGNQGRETPIEVLMKDDRGGIGMDSEKKRKIRELAEAHDAAEKKVKLTTEDYRERNRQDAEDKRVEGQWYGAMKVLEGFEDGQETHTTSEDQPPATRPQEERQPLRKINILYRPLEKGRREKEQKKKDMRSIYEDRVKPLAYVDDELDADDRLAVVDESYTELIEEDPELDEYEALPLQEKLSKVVDHLRQAHNYCFWCKYQYEDSSMDGCPGTSEDEHG
ncbi:hypothetical protein AMS68_001915 [Peltaster fructicola]|uniref:G-patch domain-containing protein n=1 Tax=Peltaster fructicola TaxID=286661 RepID=A0A6H0XP43_9PEZI|nr:hypothetical protein AMS68_001915 [Peltaster fructicola]